MSYPINQAITYTAVAVTTGLPSSSFTYAWTFDDATNATVDTYAKTWASAGSHLATVMATDTVTGATATATKTIVVKDWSTLTWVSTGINMFPLSSAAATGFAPWANKLISIGNFLINPVDYYAQQSIVAYDIVNNIRYQTDTGFNIDVGVAITEGVNVGKMLFTIQGSTVCKLYDPTTRIITTATTAKPTVPYANVGVRQSVAIGPNGTYYFHGRNNINVDQSFERYNSLTDTWTTLTASSVSVTEGSTELFHTGGKILILNHANTLTYLYDVIGGSWSAGPTSPLGVVATGNAQFTLTDTGYIVGMNGLSATAKMYSWKLGDASFTAGISLFPLASVNASANGVREHTPIALPGGFIVFVNGNETAPVADVSCLKTVFYTGVGGDAFVVGTNFLTAIPGARVMTAYASGKIWRCIQSGGNMTLEYMVW